MNLAVNLSALLCLGLHHGVMVGMYMQYGVWIVRRRRRAVPALQIH